MLKERILTACVLLIGFLLAVFFLNAPLWTGLVAALVWYAAKEWCVLIKAGTTQSFVFQAVVCVCVLCFGLADLGANRGIVSFLIYLGSFSLWLFTIPGFMRFSTPIKAGYVGYLIGFWLLFAAGVAMLALHLLSPWALLAAMVPVWLADMAAFFVGRKFGRHKLAPTISPGKTWEGAAGALCAVMIYVVVMGTIYITKVNIFALLGIAVLYTGMSILGDLFESMVKRQAGVKDSGTLLPGHGGILDRIDSLLPTLPLAAALALWLA